MKIKVLKEFRDRFNYPVIYKAGGIHDFEESRAKDIIARGLGEKAEAEEPKKKAKK